MIVECKFCRKALRVPESAADKAVRCPACQEVFKVESSAVPEKVNPRPTVRTSARKNRTSAGHEIEDYDEPREDESYLEPGAGELHTLASSILTDLNPFGTGAPSGTNDCRQLSKTAIGIRRAGYGLIGMSVSASVMIVSGLLFRAVGMLLTHQTLPGPALAGVLHGVASVTSTLGGIGILAGLILCCFIPAETGARKPLKTSGLLIGAQIVSICIHAIVDSSRVVAIYPSPVMMSAQFFAAIIFAVQVVVFGQFLGTAAVYVRRKILAERAHFAAILICISFILRSVLELVVSLVDQRMLSQSMIPMIFGSALGLLHLAAFAGLLYVMYRVGMVMRRYN